MSSARRARVLVADPDEGVRAQVRLTLAGGSYDVVEAAAAADAIEVVAAGPPDLVLLDASLPGAGGLPFTRSLKGQPETRAAVVVLLFDKAVPVDRAAGRESGVEGFLAKPFTSFALLRKVAELLPGAPDAHDDGGAGAGSP